jgi:hypothetical protein
LHWGHHIEQRLWRHMKPPAGGLTSSSSASRPAPSRLLRLKPFLMASSSSRICFDSCASAQRACAARRLDSSSLPSVASASRSSCRAVGQGSKGQQEAAGGSSRQRIGTAGGSRGQQEASQCSRRQQQAADRDSRGQQGAAGGVTMQQEAAGGSRTKHSALQCSARHSGGTAKAHRRTTMADVMAIGCVAASCMCAHHARN